MDAVSYVQGTESALLTVTITDPDDNPVTGVSIFVTIIPGCPPAETPYSETASGVYEGALDISELDPGHYFLSVGVIDSSNRRATGWAEFDIEESS